ncbi:hypothetical protein MGYG_08451 [Nannizzia gypsea CBS 118893]|uniref:HNH nuclease domain-containing protein n=1 Tax=Arthroderma gypseum (strain ATCC MYA-4604 / CBS 118893) TaxID=535722 RepID=E4V5R4_ARTGP|nr:hypothetical protein MGYG_08451 [Nannizzia gypsea CBS 118893]EFR05439.1 hypothetical protein MGYG_08451 [Nannizzia gypsea CBS 118893]
MLSPKIPGQPITQSNEHCFPWTLSMSDTSRDNTFRLDVRHRDGGCMITRRMNLEAPKWHSWEAAHIFPLALSSRFTQLGFGNNIQDDRGINSPSNGILLRADIHQDWDGYAIAVNPVDNYRVQSFTANTQEYHNLVLHPNYQDQNNPHYVLDTLLRWHYEHAVLFNMRGDGEVSFDFDFPPGTGMMGEIREGPRAAYRMEAELLERLYGYNDERSVE